MTPPLMDQIPFWVLISSVIVVIAASACTGLWVGLRSQQRESASESAMGTKVGATLALLAFMLAFTFNTAATRYDTRRKLVGDDAIAIESLYRRAPLLPPQHGSEVRQLLRELVDLRLQAAYSPETRAAAMVRSEQIYPELWRHAEDVAHADATSWRAAWFIESLSSLTDVSRRRAWAAFYSRVPPPIWISLLVLIGLSMMTVGYQAGLAKRLRGIPMVTLVLAFSVVFAVIADLDRPQNGLIRISQRPMEDLQLTLQREGLLSPPPAGGGEQRPAHGES